eukprot:6571004-Pyramimonas_sp.AAC.1
MTVFRGPRGRTDRAPFCQKRASQNAGWGTRATRRCPARKRRVSQFGRHLCAAPEGHRGGEGLADPAIFLAMTPRPHISSSLTHTVAQPNLHYGLLLWG